MQRLALILAGGIGKRMGIEQPKQLLLLENKPVFLHSIHALKKFDPKIQICLVLHESILSQWGSFAEKYGLQKILVCEGGQNRTQSVYNGLKILKESVVEKGETRFFIAIHDAARPWISQTVIEQAFATAAKAGNAIPVVPVNFSLREIQGNESKAVDRSLYVEVQTPQVFDFSELFPAYQALGKSTFSDDASLMEAYGHRIYLSKGDPSNRKITTRADLALFQENLDLQV